MANKRGRYVGPPDLHDAVIARVEHEGAIARVELVSAEQRPITLEFTGVTEFLSRGEMASHMIYALWETAEADGARRFLFVPWEDDAEPRLEIVADDFQEQPVGGGRPTASGPTMENRPTIWNGVEVPFNASIDQLASLVRGPTPDRWAAFVALAHTPGQSALTILADHARSSDPHVRRAAVEAIGVHPDGHRLGALICSLLSDTHDFVARSACEAAARHRVTDAHDAVVRLLDATPEASRVAALHSLRALWRDEDFELVLQTYSTAQSATVRREAAWTLRSAGSISTWRRLFALWCDDALPRHRQWACELAARYGSRDVRTALEGLTHDLDGHVRVAAARAIVAIEARDHP